MQLFNNSPYMRGSMEVINGDIWTFVETGPAVMVLPVRQIGRYGIEVLLIMEQRPFGRALKAVGGYLGREFDKQKKAHSLLLEEAGVETFGLSEMYREMVGFEVVRLPIAAFIANDWYLVKNGKRERAVLGLPEAIKKVLNNEVGDQCTADAIMRLYILVNHFPSLLPDFLK